MNEIFSLIDWINKDLVQNEKLSLSDIENVLGFALIWNIFEDELTEAKANAGTRNSLNLRRIKSKVEEINNKNLLKIEEFEFPLRKFISRYVTDGKLNHKFDFHFLINSPDEIAAKTNLENVLLENEKDIVNIVYALLTIAWRLRNNLFHGIKYISELREQNENFNTVNQVLAKITDFSKGI